MLHPSHKLHQLHLSTPQRKSLNDFIDWQFNGGGRGKFFPGKLSPTEKLANFAFAI